MLVFNTISYSLILIGIVNGPPVLHLTSREFVTWPFLLSYLHFCLPTIQLCHNTWTSSRSQLYFIKFIFLDLILNDFNLHLLVSIWRCLASRIIHPCSTTVSLWDQNNWHTMVNLPLSLPNTRLGKGTDTSFIRKIRVLEKEKNRPWEGSRVEDGTSQCYNRLWAKSYGYIPVSNLSVLSISYSFLHSLQHRRSAISWLSVHVLGLTIH